MMDKLNNVYTWYKTEWTINELTTVFVNISYSIFVEQPQPN